MKKSHLIFLMVHEPSEQILDYRKRLEKSDVIFMISPCYNLRATAILENWIDLVLSS